MTIYFGSQLMLRAFLLLVFNFITYFLLIVFMHDGTCRTVSNSIGMVGNRNLVKTEKGIDETGLK